MRLAIMILVLCLCACKAGSSTRESGPVEIGEQEEPAEKKPVKKAFYRHLVRVLAEAPGLRPEDVMVVITTTGVEDWSFGGGLASMVEETA